MEPGPPAKADKHSIAELVNVALNEKDEDAAWEAVCALHWRGSRDVLEAARGLCRSSCSRERMAGSDILGQIGVPERTFPEECVAILLELLEEEDDSAVLCSAFIALSHLGDPRAVSAAKPFIRHPNADVRHAVVLALTGQDSDDAVTMLLHLMNDSSPQVRDWATFGLGTQSTIDSSAIRDALAARLIDVDPDTRGEALIGLARRGDARAIATIREHEAEFAERDHLSEARAILEEKGLIEAAL